MKDKYRIGFISIVAILLIIILCITLFKEEDLEAYSKTYFYMDTYINVKVYTKDEEKANFALENIEDIFEDYHNLTDKYNDYEYGLYRLNKEGNTTIDYRLYQIIEYGYLWNRKSNGLLNIGIGNVTDIWKEYREAGTGVPSIEELKKANVNIDDILINKTVSDIYDKKVKNSVILSNGVTIDLGSLAKGYTVDVVADYLKSLNIKKYIINAGGNVLVGDSYKKKEGYSIGIQNPNMQSELDSSIFKVIKGSNIAVVTSGGYNRNYTYEGQTYGHIIDPNTLYPADKMLSVTVIGKSSKEADALSTVLFMMDVEEGKEFIKDYDVDVIWYLKDGTVITTDGISKYE